jgi:hypothetical protein
MGHPCQPQHLDHHFFKRFASQSEPGVKIGYRLADLLGARQRLAPYFGEVFRQGFQLVAPTRALCLNWTSRLSEEDRSAPLASWSG